MRSITADGDPVDLGDLENRNPPRFRMRAWCDCARVPRFDREKELDLWARLAGSVAISGKIAGICHHFRPD
jgi:hypothetical protein